MLNRVMDISLCLKSYPELNCTFHLGVRLKSPWIFSVAVIRFCGPGLAYWKLNDPARFQGMLKSTKALGSELMRASCCCCSGVILAFWLSSESSPSCRLLLASGLKL